MRDRILITLILGLALLFGGLYLQNVQKSKRLFKLNDDIFTELEHIKTAENRLHFEVQNSVLELYYDYGKLNALFDQIDTCLARLEQAFASANVHSGCPQCLDAYRARLERKQELVERLKSDNALIKNAIMIIPSLLNEHVKTLHYHEMGGLQKTVSLLTLLLMSRNTLDTAFIEQLKPLHAQLSQHYGEMMGNRELGERLDAQLDIFIKTFPRYTHILEQIEALDTESAYNQFVARYQAIVQEQQHKMTRFSYLFLAIFALFLTGTLGFLLLSNLHKSRAIRLQRQLDHQAQTDRLTGFPNRLRLERDLCEHGTKVALLLLDIDNFSRLNNLYGKTLGDDVLLALGQRLLAFAREEAWAKPQVYRVGGDCFALMLDTQSRDAAQCEQLTTRVEALLETLAHQPIQVQNLSLTIALNAALSATAPLFETAHLALNQAKSSERERFARYDADLVDRRAIEHNFHTTWTLTAALEQERLLLHYQPIFDNHSGRIAKYEALVRYRDEQGAIVYPGAFLDVAKESKLIGWVTSRVIQLASAKLHATQCSLSINLSTEDLHDRRILATILDTLEAHPALAARLTFEILETEGGLIDATSQAFLRRLQDLGAMIAIDDFGTGYSNFSRILELHANWLKIDGSLIKQIDSDRRSQKIVEGIVHFAQGVGIKTVAEFVHCEAVERQVRTMGIDYSQGFYLGKPLADTLDCDFARQ
ncbi:EAL domain-containing protein [Rhabdochromatium marinum]|uniref:EAL domain-containing protein n=1 Tax=Rhabdochromatium marinum TaxID=48729 RepID=UPI001902F247|nr:EAL domain-containing protein [Rhabdochromatium marinum]MBK1649540.1 hypothetical protein [Rhabdochromatium marinum]